MTGAYARSREPRVRDSSRGNTKQASVALNQSKTNRLSIPRVADPEPYQRLTDKPAKVSRWCSKHWLKAGDRKGGGRRRRRA
jgi:hypothetical protein